MEGKGEGEREWKTGRLGKRRPGRGDGMGKWGGEMGWGRGDR